MFFLQKDKLHRVLKKIFLLQFSLMTIQYRKEKSFKVFAKELFQRKKKKVKPKFKYLE